MNNIKKIYSFIIISCIYILCLIPIYALSETNQWTNPNTGYSVIIEDNACLLTDSEKQELFEKMKTITEKGNVVFYSTTQDISYDTRQEVINVWENQLNYSDDTSGTIFFIGMNTRQLYLYNTGYMKKCINSSYSTSIVDNAYRYATNREYAKCAIKIYDQVYTLTIGGLILQPMRIITTILLSILLSIFITYLIIKINRDKNKNLSIQPNIFENKAYKLNSGNNLIISNLHTRQYKVSKSSGSSSGSSGSSSRSSSGHSSGGGSGGGHGF